MTFARWSVCAAAVFLTGCGLNEDYMKPRIARLSDKELMRGYQIMSSGVAPFRSPQEQWYLDEMKRRGLVGAGRDGKPPE